MFSTSTLMLSLSLFLVLSCVKSVSAPRVEKTYRLPVSFPDGSQQSDMWVCRREVTPIGQDDNMRCIELMKFLHELNVQSDGGEVQAPNSDAPADL